MKKAQFEHYGVDADSRCVSHSIRVHMWTRIVGVDKIFDQEFKFKVDGEEKNIFALEPIPVVPEGKRTWMVEPLDGFPTNAQGIEWQTYIGGICVKGRLTHLVSEMWEFAPTEATLFGDLDVEGSQWYR